jgi:hypothetical protein
MIGVDAHFLLLSGERVFADIKRLELVMALKIRPPPHSTVNNMRKSFAV